MLKALAARLLVLGLLLVCVGACAAPQIKARGEAATSFGVGAM